MQVVKLHVSVLFSFALDAVPNAPCAALEAAEQTMLPLPVEKREWNGGIVCYGGQTATNEGFAEAFAAAPDFWCNAVRFV